MLKELNFQHLELTFLAGDNCYLRSWLGFVVIVYVGWGSLWHFSWGVFPRPSPRSLRWSRRNGILLGRIRILLGRIRILLGRIYILDWQIWMRALKQLAVNIKGSLRGTIMTVFSAWWISLV